MDLADLRRALRHGEDRSTVTNWVYGRRPVDPVVDALVACLERLPAVQRSEVLAPMPDLSRDRIGLVRLLQAYGMLPEAEREAVLRSMTPVVQKPTITSDDLSEVRAFLEPLWKWQQARHGRPDAHPLSTQMCHYTTTFLQRLLLDNGYDSVIASGGPSTSGDFGIQDSDGKWQGHHWIEVGGQILDLTADQFGLPAVVLADINDQRYRVQKRIKDPEQDGKLADATGVAAKWLGDWDKHLEKSGRDHPLSRRSVD